jgi:hypothetical protein
LGLSFVKKHIEMSLTLSGEFKRQVDANTARLVESYRIILKKSQIGGSLEPQTDLLLSTAAANISFHAHALLDQINEIRLHLLLQVEEEDAAHTQQMSLADASP